MLKSNVSLMCLAVSLAIMICIANAAPRFAVILEEDKPVDGEGTFEKTLAFLFNESNLFNFIVIVAEAEPARPRTALFDAIDKLQRGDASLMKKSKQERFRDFVSRHMLRVGGRPSAGNKGMM